MSVISPIIRTLSPMGAAGLAGIAVGSSMAVPTLLERTPAHGHVTNYHAFAGLAANAAIPGALIVLAGRMPLMRTPLMAAAAGVGAGWWGARSLDGLGRQ